MQHSTTTCIHHKQCAWLLQYVRKHLASGYTAKSAIALPARTSRSPLIAEVMSNSAAQDVDRPSSSDMTADEQAGPSNRFASLPDALRIPPLSYLLGNRVEHLVVEEDGLASDLIHANLGIDKVCVACHAAATDVACMDHSSPHVLCCVLRPSIPVGWC